MSVIHSISTLYNDQPERFFRYAMGMTALILIGIYGQSITYDYTLDDAIVISENMYVQEGIGGIPGLWSHDTFQGFFKEEGKETLVSGGRYRPWTPTIFILERAVLGKAPWVNHLFSILTAIAVSLFTMFVFKKLLTPRLGIKAAVFIAALAGLIYAVHPVHTEVIANIKGRDELWVLLASMACLYLMVVIKMNSVLRWTGIIIASFIAMMSKENALFLLAIIPFLYKWSQKIKLDKMIKQSLPLIIGVGVALTLRAGIVGIFPGDAPKELMNNPFLKWDGTTYVPFTATEKIGTILSSLLTYLRLYFFPYPLTHDYYPQQIARIGIFHWRSILSFLLYGSLAVIAFINLRKHRFMSLSIFLFFLTLLPVSNILFPIGTLASERFLFIPSLGLTLAIVYGIYHLKDYLRKAMVYVMLGVVVVFTAISFTRTQVWKNNFTLFSTDVKTSSASAKINNAMGGILVERAGKSESEQKMKRLAAEAVPYLKKAIEIHPTYKNSYLLLGNSAFYRNKYDNALVYYNNALSLDPNYKDALNNKFLCLRTAGRFYGEVKKNMPKAEQLLKGAVQMRPGDYEALRLLGVCMGLQKKNRKAIHYFKRALKQRNQKVSSIYKNIGIAYSGLGMRDSSQYYLQIAQQLKSEE